MFLNHTRYYIQSLVKLQNSYKILHNLQLHPPDIFIVNNQTTTYTSAPRILELRLLSIEITRHMAAMHYGTPRITLTCSVINYV